MGYLGGSKWTSKGSWKVFWTLPSSRLQNIMEIVILGVPGGITDRGVMTHAQVLNTSGPLGRVPACTGAHFRDLLILPSPVGKGFLTENPVFRKDFRKKGRDLEESKNNEAPHANSA